MNGTHGIRTDRLGRHRPRYTEIGNLHLPVTGNNHVLRFDVAMDDMLIMSGRNSLGHLNCNAYRLLYPEMPFFQNIAF